MPQWTSAATAGDNATNVHCGKTYGKPFDRLDEKQREEGADGAVVRQARLRERAAGAGVLGIMVYQTVMEGTSPDPIYGGNRDKAGWKMIGFPGVIEVNRDTLASILDKPFPTNPLSIPEIQAGRGIDCPRRILLVQLDHLGDAVLSTPLIAELRATYPDATIDVVASPSNHEVFEADPHVNRVQVAERTWFERRPERWGLITAVWKLGRSLREHRYDLGIDVRGDVLSVLVLALARVPRRVGWSMGGGSFLLTDVAAWIPGRHEVRSRLALLGRLGITPDEPARVEVNVAILIGSRLHAGSRKRGPADRRGERRLWRVAGRERGFEGRPPRVVAVSAT